MRAGMSYNQASIFAYQYQDGTRVASTVRWATNIYTHIFKLTCRTAMF